jgi:hypothetical protein
MSTWSAVTRPRWRPLALQTSNPIAAHRKMVKIVQESWAKARSLPGGDALKPPK